MSETQIAIVGAGPRGTSTLERIIASARSFLEQGTKLTIHVIDPYPAGAGSVWRVEQPPRLLMNTIASQVTLFTDDDVKCEGPRGGKHSGPTLYEWGKDADGFRLGEKDYATRSQHGLYLVWAFNEARRRASSQSIAGTIDIKIEEHRAKAIALDNEPESGPNNGKQVLKLVTVQPSGSCSELTLSGLSAVILTQGHLSREYNDEQKSYIQHARDNPQTQYFAPSNPAEINFDTIKANEKVFLRGLGLVFFDYMILLTARRGGWFERQKDGSFEYHKSGSEPQIYASSRGGIPYLTKGDDQKTASDVFKPKFLTEQALEELKNCQSLNFQEVVWPIIQQEVEFVYYKTLAKEKGEQVDDQVLLNFVRQNDRQCQPTWVGADEIWNWERLQKPQLDKKFTAEENWNEWLLEYLQNDVNEAKKGNVKGPQRAALDVLREIRNSVRDIISCGKVERGSLEKFTKLNTFLTTGPPRRRVEQMIALMKANILHVLGPGSEVKHKNDYWEVTSKNPGHELKAKTLIEAYIPPPSLTHTADELLKYLHNQDECRAHKINGIESGAIDITSETFNIIKSSGEAHPRRFAIGVPAEGLHWFTTIQPRPGADSINLRQTDAIARAALKLAQRDQADPPPPPGGPSSEANDLRVWLEPKSHSVEGHTSECTLFFNSGVIWGPSSCHGNTTQLRNALQAADPRFDLKMVDKPKTIEGHTVTISVERGNHLYLNRLSTHGNMYGLCDAINRALNMS